MEGIEIMNKESLCEWVIAARDGDEQAFSVLYENYYYFAYHAAFKLTSCDADAKDAVQMSFIQVHKSIGSLKKPEFFPLWLHRIVTSKCKDIFRANRDVTYDNEYFRYNSKIIEHRTYFLADKQMHFDSDRDVFMELFLTLSDEMQEVLWLFYFEDMKISEIASLLHVNENTIKSRMRRAKELLIEAVQLYEKREHVKLDFHEEVIGSVLAISLIPFFSFKSSGLQQSIFASKSVVMMSVLGVAGSVGVYGIYQEVQKQQHQTSEVSKSIIEEQPSTQAKEAYFKLCNWTFDKGDIAAKSKESAEEMRPYYDYLKAQGGEYYQTLVKTGWAQAFEEI